MSQSLTATYIHATFGTKARKPTINDKIAPQLHAFMAGAFNKIDSPALIINSVPYHIHTLYRMSKNASIADIMEKVKKSSSFWMKQQDFGTKQFYWQKGYGAFSISRSQVEIVTRYIANQKEHHQTLTYVEEVQRLMDKYNVKEFNPDYYRD